MREKYLLQLVGLKGLKKSIFYSIYQNTKEYTPLISLTIAKAVFVKKKGDYRVTIIIDGLSKKAMEKVREELKKLTVRYRNIRGMKDKQSVFLRLADSMAGFLRDCFEKQTYTKALLKKLKLARIIIEI